MTVQRTAMGLERSIMAWLRTSLSMAAFLHDTRKQNVLQEANTIGTAYLRADLLDESARKEMRALLREYVDVRLSAASGGELDAALARPVEIHNHLWNLLSSAAVASPGTNTTMVVQSINGLIDMHEKRVTGALRNRIPNSIYIAVLAISVLAMITLGGQIGLGGRRRLVAVVPLALAFAVLITLVVDLDRPQKGLITVGQEAIKSLPTGMSPESK